MRYNNVLGRSRRSCFWYIHFSRVVDLSPCLKPARNWAVWSCAEKYTLTTLCNQYLSFVHLCIFGSILVRIIVNNGQQGF